MTKLYVKSRPCQTLPVASPVKLPFPAAAHIRLAQLCQGDVPAFGDLAPFCPKSYRDIQRYKPNMLVGTALELQRLAEQVELGAMDLSSVDHAVIVLTRCGRAPLSDVARVVLWQTFGVPVYEVFVAFDNAILGYECELHEGWHLAPHVGFSNLNGELMLDSPGVSGLHTALTGFVTQEKCPCGRTGGRLLNLEPITQLAGTQRWAAIA